MDADDAAARRRLCLAARTPGLGAGSLAALAAASADLALLEQPAAARRVAPGLTAAGLAWLAAPDESRLQADLRWLETSGCRLLPATDPRYPALLRESADPPAVLFVRGQAAQLGGPLVAMVGSRNPTPGGRATAREFAARFAAMGIGVTSGLALGIDAASHEGALSGGGPTIAVLGHGLDRIYPAEHAALAERIAAAGALVTEFPPGTGVQRHHFPRRNRIIAGLSLGTLVVEAALDSGSLITARQAGEAGREVFAIPGSILNPLARGCHELIRQGAKLVERVEDVLSELKISLCNQLLAESAASPVGAPRDGRVLDKEYKILLDALAFEPASVDSLIERTGMNSESIASMLLILELEGLVAPLPGGRYSRMAGPLIPTATA